MNTLETPRVRDVLARLHADAAAEQLLLYQLARYGGARQVVEFGTSLGISTIYLAAAVRDSGGGRVIGTVLQPDKAEIARRNLADAGLAGLVEIRAGDPVETLANLPTPLDLALIDGFPELSLDVLKLIEPRLRAGAMVVAGGVPEGDAVLRGYRDYVRDVGNGYLSTAMPLGDQLDLSLRIGELSTAVYLREVALQHSSSPYSPSKSAA